MTSPPPELSRVQQRIVQFLESRDPGAVLGGEAEADITALSAALGRRGDPAASHLLGWLHYCRASAVPVEDSGPDFRAALRRFLEAGTGPEALTPLLNLLADGLAEPVLANGLGSEGESIRQSAEGRPDVQLLDQAVTLLQWAVALTPDDDPDRFIWLTDLGICWHMWYERTGEIEHLDEAVRLFRIVLDHTPEGHPNRLGRMARLGNALSVRRTQGQGEDGDLAVALDLMEAAVSGTAEDDPGRTGLVFNLAAALETAHHDDPDPALLRRADVLLSAEAARLPEGHPLQGMLLGKLINARLAAGADLLPLIPRLRAALTRMPPAVLYRASAQHSLARALLATGAEDRERLEEAVALLRSAEGLLRPEGPDHGTVLDSLADALRARYRLTGRPADFDAAWQAVERLPPETAGDKRAVLLLERYERGLDPADLDAALHHLIDGRDRAELPAVTALLAGYLAALRHERTGDPADLDLAVDLSAGAADGAPDRGEALAWVGALHLLRYEQGGAPDDAAQAIRYAEESLALAPPSGAPAARRLEALASALRDRGDRTGSRADLEESVRLLDRVVAMLPEDPATDDRWPQAAKVRTNLGLGLLNLAARTRDEAVLGRAIAEQSAALELTDDGDPRAPARRARLAMAYKVRHDLAADPDDLDRAIGEYRTAVKTAAPDDPQLSLMLSSLSNALRERYLSTEDEDDIVEALATAQRSLDPALGENDLARRLQNLAAVAHVRFDHTGDPADLEPLVSSCTRILELPGAPVQSRITASSGLGHHAHRQGDLGTALGHYRRALGLLPVLVGRGLAWSDQQYLVEQVGAMALDAASCALDAGDPALAVAFLEQGRGVLWSRLARPGVDSSPLRAAAPELAAELERLWQVLSVPLDEAPEGAAPAGPPGPWARAFGEARPEDSARARAARRDEQARRFAELLDQARRLTGPQDPAEDWALPPLGEDGPVVVLNVGDRRCDALILREDGGPRVVPLPGLTRDGVRERFQTYLFALIRASGGGHVPFAVAAAADLAVRDTLAWLWTDVVEPVLNALELRHGPGPGEPWPRVWWCPTDVLTLLPLHAAGLGPGACALDRVVSSYAVTLGSLASARTSREPSPPRLLTVTVPNPEGHRPLSGPGQEAAFLTPHTVLHLDGPDATRERVLAELPAYPWFHFSGHGVQNLTDPSLGGLVVHDGLLRITELITAIRSAGDAPGGELALLGACQTATGGLRQPDESLHLTAAVHVGGFRHVVGGLWNLYDGPSAELSRAFYAGLADGGSLDSSRAAVALHTAVRALRDRHPGRPTIWAPYVHFGP